MEHQHRGSLLGFQPYDPLCIEYKEDLGELSVIGLSRDKSLLTVGGRKEYKVLKINKDSDTQNYLSIEMDFKYLTRSRKSLDFSIYDVKWNPHPINEHLSLTCSTSGKIFLWDYNSATKHNHLKKFELHSNKSKLSWSHHEPGMFISGSVDTKIFMWDIKMDKKINEFMT